MSDIWYEGLPPAGERYFIKGYGRWRRMTEDERVMKDELAARPSFASLPQLRTAAALGVGAALAAQRVYALFLPDHFDLVRWGGMCGIANEQAQLVMSPSLAVSGARFETEITYPHLRRKEPATWVYIAWRGRLRWKHAGRRIEKLDVDDLNDTAEDWANLMQVGEPYLWVQQRPTEIAIGVAPPEPRQGVTVLEGRIPPRSDEGAILWS